MELFQTVVSHDSLACADVKGIDMTDPNTTKSDLVFSYLSVHDVGIQFHVMYSRNVVVEYCYFARNSSNAACHSEFWSDFNGSDSLTFRYNLFEDIEGTAVFAWVNGSGTAINWRIYGNIITYTSSYTDGDGVSGVIYTDYTCQNWRVHNNTIVNGQGLWSGFRVGTASSGCVAYNNLWYNCVRTAHYNFTLGYSWYNSAMNRDGDDANVQLGSADPLVNSGSGDFHLKAATNAGYTLAAPFNQDMYGTVRGADGVWDRGALEYRVTGVSNDEFRTSNVEWKKRASHPNPLKITDAGLLGNVQFCDLAGRPVQPEQITASSIFLVGSPAEGFQKVFLIK
jgi:hypothetical protein